MREPRNVFHGVHFRHALVGGSPFNGRSVTAYSEAFRPYQKPRLVMTMKPFVSNSSSARHAAVRENADADLFQAGTIFGHRESPSAL
jgi:hypothetical protein